MVSLNFFLLKKQKRVKASQILSVLFTWQYDMLEIIKMSSFCKAIVVLAIIIADTFHYPHVIFSYEMVRFVFDFVVVVVVIGKTIKCHLDSG